MSERSRRRRLRAALFAAALAGIVVFFAWPRDPAVPPPRPEVEQPPLMLMTSLPLLFGEHFGLDDNGSPAMTALERRYRIVPIGIADSANLSQGKLLLMAHANAQPAEALVDLDKWVRDGGHLLLLADPMLGWPSERPLGDVLRPSPMFMDTGLLAHWGLRLQAPPERGPAQRMLAGRRILTSSPGHLSGGSEISRAELIARCAIGKGQAVIVADADFLNVEDRGSAAGRNLDALLATLATLEPKPRDS